MTYYSEIKKELKDADKPLTCKEIHSRVGGHRTKVYQVLKRMRRKEVVIADRHHDQNGVYMYQWRQP